MFDVTAIATIVITLMVTLITVFVIPVLVKKYGKDKVAEALTTINTVYDVALFVCRAMEQLYPSVDGKKMGDIKLEEATANVKDILEKHNISYNEEEVRLAIESAVNTINNKLKEELE